MASERQLYKARIVLDVVFEAQPEDVASYAGLVFLNEAVRGVRGDADDDTLIACAGEVSRIVLLREDVEVAPDGQ